MSNDKSLIVEGNLADNERMKGASKHLRGTIAEDLKDDVTGGLPQITSN